MSATNAEIRAWGEPLRGAGSLFKDIPTGARFVFRADQADSAACILIRTPSGYRHEIGGRVWKTGARTACHLLPEFGIGTATEDRRTLRAMLA